MLYVTEVQIYFFAQIVYTQLPILEDISSESFDEAFGSLRHALTAIGRLITIFARSIKLLDGYSDELTFLLIGIRLLYNKSQYYSLLKIFSNEKFQDGKKEVKFSEIFNPIYLALISLDPEGKKVNIAPEKEQIVRQVRDYLTSK